MKCTICHSHSVTEHKYDDWDVYRCTNCSHSFSCNIKRHIEEIYDKKYFERNWFKYPNLNLFKQIEKQIRNNFGKNAKIYDLGCGNGNFLQFAHENGYVNLSGSDLFSSLKKEISGKVKFEHKGFESVNVEKKYDVVISISNIGHISDIEKYMQILNSLLIPGGIAAIYTINENALLYSVSKLLRKFGIIFASKQLYDPHQFNFFSTKSLKQLIIKNNFNYLKLATSNFPLKSTDIFVDSYILKMIVYLGIWSINLLSTIVKKEIGQLVFIQKK